MNNPISFRVHCVLIPYLYYLDKRRPNYKRHFILRKCEKRDPYYVRRKLRLVFVYKKFFFSVNPFYIIRSEMKIIIFLILISILEKFRCLDPLCLRWGDISKIYNLYNEFYEYNNSLDNELIIPLIIWVLVQTLSLLSGSDCVSWCGTTTILNRTVSVDPTPQENNCLVVVVCFSGTLRLPSSNFCSGEVLVQTCICFCTRNRFCVVASS